jgi:hypothetical protein
MSSGDQSPFETISNLFIKQKIYCDLFLSSENMMNELNNADILIGDALYLCSSLVADQFDIPHVEVSMGSLTVPTLMVFGLSSNPAYVPQRFSALSKNMGFLDRIKNCGFYLMNIYVVERYCYPLYGELKAKYKIKPEKSIRETIATVDMILLTMSIITDHAQPILPSK